MIINNSIFQLKHINSVICYDTTDSTNLRAKEFAKKTDVHGILFLADRQTAGKGRLGRDFISPEATGIYASLLLRPTLSMERYSQITIIAAVAVANAIKETTDISVHIKWPNDIVVDGKKLVGILTEGGPNYAIVGIGVNVNNHNFPDNIADVATSLYITSGKKIDRAILLNTILNNFNKLYEELLISDNLDFIIDEYNNLLINKDKDIYIIPHHISDTTNHPYMVDTVGLESMHCLGIDSYGNLLCQDASGTTHSINSGEVSVRGIDSYSS